MFLSASSKCESPHSPPLFIFVVRESVNQRNFAFFASGYTGEWSGSVRGGDKADSLLPKRLSGAPFAGAVIPRVRPAAARRRREGYKGRGRIADGSTVVEVHPIVRPKQQSRTETSSR